MPTATINDVRIQYEVAGAGPRVVYVSGTGSDLRQRPTVFEGPLGAACTVLAYDHRGLGRSEIRDEPVTMADFADDAAALTRHVGWDRVAVVGVSFGGMVAQEIALRHPDLVDRLVLCCTSSGGPGGASYPLHELEAAGLEEDAMLRRRLAISDTRFGEEWQASDPVGTARCLEGMRTRAAAVPNEPGAATGARRQLEARASHDTWERLPEIEAPTLVCAGRYDGIAPVANSEALAARIPRAHLRVFEGGHLFLLQDRSAWPAIVDFIAA
ncbi:MAG TPA: alpha/beta hydrolase [Acidimicrobiales bacterium]|nr:alpha/beta hydrolase [Acidimicrobiales bacterium]